VDSLAKPRIVWTLLTVYAALRLPPASQHLLTCRGLLSRTRWRARSTSLRTRSLATVALHLPGFSEHRFRRSACRSTHGTARFTPQRAYRCSMGFPRGGTPLWLLVAAGRQPPPPRNRLARTHCRHGSYMNMVWFGSCNLRLALASRFLTLRTLAATAAAYGTRQHGQRLCRAARMLDSRYTEQTTLRHSTETRMLRGSCAVPHMDASLRVMVARSRWHSFIAGAMAFAPLIALHLTARLAARRWFSVAALKERMTRYVMCLQT